MRKKWWWFRLFVFIFAMVVLGAYLMNNTPWRKALGLLPTYKKEIAQGDNIVEAIYEFRLRTTLWPEYLEDLGLPPETTAGWFYELNAVGDGRKSPRKLPTLSTAANQEGMGRAHLGFDFDLVNPAWHVFGSVPERMVKSGRPARKSMMGYGMGELFYAGKELDRRIEREPGMVEHYRDKASLLFLQGRNEEAKNVIDLAREKLPGNAWVRLAEAVLDWPAKNEAFAEWVKGKPSFTREFDLSWVYRRMGNEDLAAEAMERAMDMPLEVDADDDKTVGFYLFDMERWAMGKNRMDLAGKIGATWEKAFQDGKVKDVRFEALKEHPANLGSYEEMAVFEMPE